jgi:hypothetical protein
VKGEIAVDAYMFQAALYCAPCGESIRARLTAEGKAPENPMDEHSFDSDDFPKGPFPDGGGEADSEQHCDACAEALDNPLTDDGQRARAERLAPKYLDLEPEEIGRGQYVGHSAGELRDMLDALDAAYELLPLTDEGHAVFDGMSDALKAELQKIEYHFYSNARN